MRVMITSEALAGERGTVLLQEEETALVVLDGSTDATRLPLADVSPLDASDDDPDAGTIEWQRRRQGGDCQACMGAILPGGAAADNGWAVHPECVTT
jgi:hypothetical protein